MSHSPDEPSVTPPKSDAAEPPRRSASAEGFALRWAEQHPEEDVDHVPPRVPAPDDGVPNRHSASAEAAALRLREREDAQAGAEDEHPGRRDG